MTKRFKYETPGAFRKALLTVSAPHRWRAKTRPWIFDNNSGVRFQLDLEEDAVMGHLTSRLPKEARSPDPSTLGPAFDHVVMAIMERRRGYVSDWHRLKRWTPGEWESWLGSLARDAQGHSAS